MFKATQSARIEPWVFCNCHITRRPLTGQNANRRFRHGSAQSLDIRAHRTRVLIIRYAFSVDLSRTVWGPHFAEIRCRHNLKTNHPDIAGVSVAILQPQNAHSRVKYFDKYGVGLRYSRHASANANRDIVVTMYLLFFFCVHQMST